MNAFEFIETWIIGGLGPPTGYAELEKHCSTLLAGVQISIERQVHRKSKNYFCYKKSHILFVFMLY